MFSTQWMRCLRHSPVRTLVGSKTAKGGWTVIVKKIDCDLSRLKLQGHDRAAVIEAGIREDHREVRRERLGDGQREPGDTIDSPTGTRASSG